LEQNVLEEAEKLEAEPKKGTIAVWKFTEGHGLTDLISHKGV
jgi:hypothetical protein